MLLNYFTKIIVFNQLYEELRSYFIYVRFYIIILNTVYPLFGFMTLANICIGKNVPIKKKIIMPKKFK